MFDDQKQNTASAVGFFDTLRSQGISEIGPGNQVQRPLMDAVAASIREGKFSLSLLGHFPDGLRTAILEYLNAEGGYQSAGVAPSAAVTLKNISGSPVHFCLRTIPIERPQMGQTLTYSSVTGKQSSPTYQRDYASLEPGEEMELPVSKANALLFKYSIPYHSAATLLAPRAPVVDDRLREVKGHLTAYDVEPAGELLEWGVVPPATPIPVEQPKKKRKPATKKSRAKKAKSSPVAKKAELE